MPSCINSWCSDISASQPTIATHPGFAYPVAAVYGLLSGIFAARTLRVLRLLRRPAAATA